MYMYNITMVNAQHCGVSVSKPAASWLWRERGVTFELFFAFAHVMWPVCAC